MSAAARGLLGALDDEQRSLATRRFDDLKARHWIEYRPAERPGAPLSNLDGQARKAAHRLLATGLSPHAYAQAMAIVALEEVLDRQEGWHLSVTMTVVDGVVSPAPVFFGANPHRVMYDGRAVLAPLAAEEELARALLDAMTPSERAVAVVSDTAPYDIRSATSARASALEPAGVSASSLGGQARDLLDRIVRMYLDRLPAQLQPSPGEVRFAWEGPTVAGGRHYYRIQGDDLLIEYDNTQEDGNHAHTVLRRPRGDFGEDVLGKHLDLEHPPM
jgi:hypothetical protein